MSPYSNSNYLSSTVSNYCLVTVVYNSQSIVINVKTTVELL